MKKSIILRKEKFHYENLQLYLRLRVKLKKLHRILELNQSQWLKSHIEFNTKNIEAEKYDDKDGKRKPFYKLMNDDIYGNTM